jgi:hypothetical protein
MKSKSTKTFENGHRVPLGYMHRETCLEYRFVNLLQIFGHAILSDTGIKWVRGLPQTNKTGQVAQRLLY